MKRNLLTLAIYAFISFLIITTSVDYSRGQAQNSESKSQSFNKSKIDSLFNILAEKNKAMGSVSLSKNGTIVYQKAIGYTNIKGQAKTPANENSKYRIGSISKTFTTVILFQMIEEGKLQLTTTLDKYFPKLPNANKITIKHLLTHRSGLHDFTGDSLYLTYLEKPKTHEEILDMITKGNSDFQPDEKTVYCNSNFVVLGYIIEKIEKKDYSVILKERITSKIGLNNTYYGGKINANNNECNSYKFESDWTPETETDMSIPHGAGAIVSTPTDLVKFIDALFSYKLITQKSLNQMVESSGKMGRMNVGMGIFEIPMMDKKAYGHNGGIDGFVNMLFYIPEEKVAIAYSSNGSVFSMNEIVKGTLSIYFNKEYKLPVFTTYNVTSADLDKYTGEYSSKQIPLIITVTKKDAVLYAQATGQPSFPIQATAKDVFKYEAAGITMEFNPDKKEFTLKQGGQAFLFELKK